jgi:hypothetical protein
MDCEWIEKDGKFECKYCHFTVPRATMKRNCPFLNNQGKEPPNIIKRGKNLARAAVGHMVKGNPHCTEGQKQERYKVCQSNQCGLFRQYRDGGLCAHDDCGCYIRSNGQFMDKLSWADSKCPVGFWGPIETDENEQNS